ncbi:dethiobiotin synthase [Saccharopolyspora sp. HNM0983]|uniref:ATP-dependent dethiobiotin synthetase BioD n=1 Tax=Saccharopolyspora montiporae TaxID=2781240 RepID=A0A929G189_9PSEU|nr:dethiobiotin synthase [Saccharopolyspora sp. HNM0983]
MITVVTGTGTGVGKTVAAAALAVHIGPDCIVAKPVQTGIGDDETDIGAVRRLAGCPVVEFTRLRDPLAPDTAARLRAERIPRVGEHAARVRELAAAHEHVIIEGAGGLLVRLDTAGGTLRDLAADLARDHPVRIHVVTGIALGALNHAALTVEALAARDLRPTGLVLGAVPEAPGLAERCNLADLPRVTGVPIAAALPDAAGSLDPEIFRERARTWFAAP